MGKWQKNTRTHVKKKIKNLKNEKTITLIKKQTSEEKNNTTDGGNYIMAR